MPTWGIDIESQASKQPDWRQLLGVAQLSRNCQLSNGTFRTVNVTLDAEFMTCRPDTVKMLKLRRALDALGFLQ